jgi:hypothetical protein
VAKDSTDDGIAISATITQQYAEADNQSINLSLPFSASPRLSALASACTSADLTTCPPVGTATVVTPLLSQALTATIVLVGHTGALPTLAILIPPPFGIELDATPILAGTSVQALVANIPDIPISSLTLNLPGGANSLFRAGIHLCSAPQAFGGTFTAWSGATASPSAAATVSGCSSTPAPAVTPAAPAASPAPSVSAIAPSSGGLRPAAARASGQVAFAGLTGRTPRVTVALGGGSRFGTIRSVALRLPARLGVDKTSLARGIRVKLDGRTVATSATYANGVVKVVFARAGRVAIITLSAPAVRVSRSVQNRHGRRLVLVATVRGATGRAATLRLTAGDR